MAGGSKKLPAFQFYPGDWRKDPGVQALDFHDRGVWFEMLCLMHESEERGVLLLNGRPMDESALARLLGLDKQILTTTLTTLLTYGVASRREEDDAIVCRRMVRDEHLRQVRQSAGRKGGNPRLLKQNSTTPDKQNPTPSSSISSSSSDVKDPPTPHEAGAGQSPEMDEQRAAVDQPDDEILLLSAWEAAEGRRRYTRSVLTDVRRRDLFQRLLQPDGWPWRDALEKFPLAAARDGPDGWLPTMEWFLREGTVEAILEGKYDFRPGGKRGSGAGERASAGAGPAERTGW